jgi:O-antigen/teichoic acid export membrane protein
LSRDLKNKFIYQLAISGTQVLLPLLTYPFITRVLGPAAIGKINYVDFLSQLFIVFAAFGIPMYGVREVARLKDQPAGRAVVISELAIINIIFSLCAAAIFLLFTAKNWQQDSVLYLLAAVNIIASAFSFEWFLQGTEAFRFSAIRTLLIRCLMIAAIFLLIKKPADYSTYFAIYTVAFLLIAILNSARLSAANMIVFKGLRPLRHLPALWHFFLTSSAISIYFYFDAIILQHLTHDNEATGYYSFTLKMVRIFLLVILALGTVLSPRVSYLVGNNKTTDAGHYLNRLLAFVVLLATPAAIGMMLLAPEIITVIAGPAFLPAVPVLRILAWLPLVVGINNVFCFQTLVPFKQEKKFLFAVLSGCVLSIGLNFLLIPALKESGAAIANICTETAIAVISGLFALKYHRFVISRPLLWQTLIGCLLFIPVVALCRYWMPAPLPVLLMAIPGCIGVYFIVLYSCKNELLTGLLSFMRNLQNRQF